MNADQIKMPTLIFPKCIVRTRFATNTKYRHRFGGPLERKVHGWPQRMPGPQRLLTFELADPTLRGLGLEFSGYISRLPLLYAFQVSPCRFKYEVESLKLVEFEGESEGRDWPYENYPERFPIVPLALENPKAIDWKKLENDEDWHGITAQDSRPEKGELLVVVPPNDGYGVSLWGEEGDAECVQTIFRIDMRAGTVETWNECT